MKNLYTYICNYKKRIKFKLLEIMNSDKCIDNTNISDKEIVVKHCLSPQPASKRAKAAYSQNNKILSKSVLAHFTTSHIVEFKDATLVSKSGFAYTASGKLICPPNWPLRVLISFFPINNLLSNTEKTTNVIEYPIFYFLGPSTYNYYHWLTDKLTLIYEYLTAKQEYYPNLKLLCHSDLPKTYMQGLYKLGIEDDDILYYDGEKTEIKQLILASSNKAISDEKISQTERLKWLRQVLSQGNIHSDKPIIEKIFIKREDKRIKNNAELEALAKHNGYAVVDMSTLKLREQIQYFNNAKKVIGIHGAGLTNLIFCQPQTEVIEILPSSYPARYYTDICQSFDLDHKVFYVEEIDQSCFLNLELFSNEFNLNNIK